MTIRNEIICLANSDKYGGRCVAGVAVDTGEWIRPVSERDDGELKSTHYTTVGGHNPEPLEVIRIYLEESAPKPMQPENWKLADRQWELVSDTLTPTHFSLLDSILQSGPELFGDQSRSIQAGNEVDESLALVNPDNPIIQRKQRINKGDQPRLRFELEDVNYNLPITDPIWKRTIFAQVDSGHRVDLIEYIESDCVPILTVSLGTEFDGQHWKLVAGIMGVPEEFF